MNGLRCSKLAGFLLKITLKELNYAFFLYGTLLNKGKAFSYS